MEQFALLKKFQEDPQKGIFSKSEKLNLEAKNLHFVGIGGVGIIVISLKLEKIMVSDVTTILL